MKNLSSKTVVINADDFGLLPEVNKGIIECFEAGSITSTSMMVNTEGTSDAVNLAKQYPSLGVGLHFSLTQGSPVSSSSKVASLVSGDGGFHSRSAFERKMLFGNVRLSDVETEFMAQVCRFDKLGLEMTHIDSHHHVHIFPGIFKLVSTYAKNRGIPVRIPWVCYKLLKPSLNFSGLKTTIRKLLLNLLVSRIPTQFYKQIVLPGAFLSVHDFVPFPKQLSSEHYLRLLKEAAPGLTEIMVHPAYNTRKLETLFNDSKNKEMELKALTSFSLIMSAENMGIEAVSFRKYLA